MDLPIHLMIIMIAITNFKDESYNDLLSDDLSKINQSIRLHFITESLYDVR